MSINVSQNNPRAAYTATAGQTAFTVSFVFYESTDLTVYKNGSVVNAADYTVSGGNGATGTVTLDTGAVLNDEVVIVRDVPIERTTDLTSSYNASSIDDQLDRIAVQIADLNDLAGRSLKVNDWEVDPPLTLPSLNTRKGKVLGFNLSTGAMEATLNSSEVGALAGITGDISALAALDTEIGALYAIRTDIDDLGSIAPAITAVNANASNVTATATNIANVNLVGASIADVNDVADSLGEISYVYNKLDNIDTVALGISNVNTVASNIAATNAVGSNIAAVTSVNASLTQVGTVHTNIANVNVVGNSIDDVNDVAVAITDVTTVSDGLANINTVAGIAGNVSTVAGISSSVSTVAGITGNIASVVSNASNISTTASGISNINSVASSISNVNTVAGNIGNVNTVALDSADISTVAGIAGFVPTLSNVSNEIFAVAGNLSKITTVNSNAASITTVANNITDVNTVAGISGSVSTVAGITGNIASVVSNAASITTVAGSITNVNTVAGEIDAVVSIQGSVSAAATSESNAATSASAASSSATTASGHATSAAASAAAAASTASGIAGFDLDAIAASKAVTATDVFVYDTSKDSDGGAWRKRTQHTSWYNETLNTSTRGARKEFPAVAVIVAESNKVTIYDGDDPALPMWMVFNAATDHSRLVAYGTDGYVSCVFALNGILLVGTYSGTLNGSCTGLSVADFPADAQRKYDETGLIKSPLGLYDRNDNTHGLWWHSTLPRDFSKAIIVQYINDVAMTVLPDAPIDPATGLPVPTIAVATAGGVSVIKDDGTVVDITGTLSGAETAISDTYFDGDDTLWFLSRSNSAQGTYLVGFTGIPSSDVLVSTAPLIYAASGSGYVGTAQTLLSGVSQINAIADGAAGSQSALNLISENIATPSKGMVAYTTSTYNTGWMNGNIKGAFLSSTDATSLVGSGELVTNGDGSTLTGWDDISSGTGTVASVGGEFELVRIDLSNRGIIEQTIATTVGTSYVVSIDRVSGTNVSLGIGTSSGSFSLLLVNLLAGTNTFTFTATSVTTYLNVRGTVDGTAYIDNISVKLADPDRSVNSKGLIVNGTVTKSAVATGADLVAYSGFSASNYLEQPYNSDLDFTSEMSIMFWVKNWSNGTDLLHRGPANTRNSATSFALYNDSGYDYRFVLSNNGTTEYNTEIELAGNLSGWQFVCFKFQRPTVTAFLNGELQTTNSAVDFDIFSQATNKNSLYIGLGPISVPDGNAELALLRISATAPSPEQIKKIYEDEKVLFQDNAAATLYGSSNAVTALAHDEDTGLLHVGTSAGRSVFQGLRRVDNTTTAVGAAISASNGLVADE